MHGQLYLCNGTSDLFLARVDLFYMVFVSLNFLGENEYLDSLGNWMVMGPEHLISWRFWGFTGV